MSSRIIHLYCYICGQGYGSASIERHMRTCPETWNNEQKHLPIKLQVPVPDPPNAELPTSLTDQKKCKAWNDEAYEIAMNNRNKCPYCNRGFFSDKIVKHIHVCPKKPKDADVDALLSNKKKVTSKPRFFICGICGREYGTASIERHLKQCLEQFGNDQKHVPEYARRPVPDLDELLKEIEEIKADGKITQAEIDEQRENAMKTYKEGLAECPNCHRTFESEVLTKHMKGCKAREFKFGYVFDPDIDDEDDDDDDDDDDERERDYCF